jgi:hypothetical protein
VYAEEIHVSNAASHEPEPMEAGALTVLSRALKPASAPAIVTEGQLVPDFALTDQAGQPIHLAQYQGKVVALTFGYSRCPNPQYCFRMSNNLAHVEKRLRGTRKEDLVLMTIMMDPDYDRGKNLSQFADTWKADPRVWHFLTGPARSDSPDRWNVRHELLEQRRSADTFSPYRDHRSQRPAGREYRRESILG